MVGICSLWHAGLLESMSAAVAHPSLPAIEQDIASLVGDEDTEARQMRAVAIALLAILDSLAEVHSSSSSSSSSSSQWCIGGDTRVYGVYQPPGFLTAYTHLSE